MMTVVLSSGVCAADGFSGQLTLQDCLVRAQARSEMLRIQVGKQDEAAARLKQARGGVLPDVRFKVAKTLRDSAGNTVAGDQTDSRFAVTQPLFSGFRRVQGIDLAKSELTKENYNYADINRDVREQVIRAFYTLAAIDAVRVNIQTTAQSMSVRLKELGDRVRLGKSRDSEVLMTESQLAALYAQNEKSGGDRAGAVEAVSFLTDVPAAGLTVQDDHATIRELPAMTSFTEKLNNRADIQSAQQSLLSQSLRVGIVAGGLLPTLDFNGSWYTLRSGSLANSSWEALLSLDVPLFQGGIARGRVNEEKARLREAEQTVSLLTRAAGSLLRTRYEAAASSIKQATAYTDAFEKASKSYQMQLRDYQYGLVNNLDVIQALLSMLDVKQNMDTALIQVKLDKALLEEAVR